MVHYVSVPKGAAKLQHIKVRVNVFYRTNGHPQSLAEHNLQPLELQGHTTPFWKPPNLINLEPRGQGHESAFRMRQAFLK